MYEKIVIWERELRIGAYWACFECKGKNSIALGVVYEKPPSKVN